MNAEKREYWAPTVISYGNLRALTSGMKQLGTTDAFSDALICQDAPTDPFFDPNCKNLTP